MLRGPVCFDGLIVSFEPIPKLASRLRSSCSADSKWQVRELALAEEAGLRSFNVMVSDQFSSLNEPTDEEVALFSDSNRIQDRIEVQTDTLSSQFHVLQEELGFRAPFLKLDTQGSDLSILEQAPDALQKFVGLQSEVAVKRIYENSVEFSEALRRYRELGFEFSAIVPNNSGSFPALVELDIILLRKDLLTERKA